MSEHELAAKWLACEFDGHKWSDVDKEKYREAASALLDVLHLRRTVKEPSDEDAPVLYLCRRRGK